MGEKYAGVAEPDRIAGYGLKDRNSRWAAADNPPRLSCQFVRH